MLFDRKRGTKNTFMKHEVFFEDELIDEPIESNPLFIGRAFTKRRFMIASVALIVSLSFLIGRAAWMQVVEGSAYQARSERNRLREVPIPPKRGIIFDRTGNILADNVSRFQVTMTPSNLPLAKESVETELSVAARLLGRPINELRDIAYATGTARDETYLVADDLPYEQAMSIALELPNFQGFQLEIGSRRRYPYSKQVQSISHVLGYLGKLNAEEYSAAKENGYRLSDDIGKTGVEKSYEQRLRGSLGEEVSEVDAHGKPTHLVARTEPTDGEDLHLTLDIELQEIAEKALQAQMEDLDVARGSVIAMDPRDGSILALVSWPAFDNNHFSGVVSSTYYQALIEDEDHPLFARAWAGTYPSGSTVKILMATAALAEGIIDEHTSMRSVGGIRIGQWFFPDWLGGGHGITDVRKAIAQSVNTFFYTIGGGYEGFVGLGVERIAKWLDIFRLGRETGIDIPGEVTGHIPTPEWKQAAKDERWYVGDTYNLSIGQGDLLVTPLQVAGYTAAIANGGTYVTPHVVKDAETNEEYFGDDIHDDIEIVREGMRETVTLGSGRGLAHLPVPIAGKSGTAQWHSEKETHAWFTSFAPFEEPEIVIMVLLEQGGEGSSTAVPVVRDIYTWWWQERANRGGAF